MVALDFLVSLRFLARRKVVALVAVLTMACALGVNTAAIAVLRAFLFSNLGVPEPDRVVIIGSERELPGRGNVLFNDAYPNYEIIRQTQRSFAEVTTLLQNVVSWRNGDDVRPLQVTRATATFFPTMRVSPILGRPFTPDEEGPSPAPVVVVSHALWTGALNSDPSVIGRAITIDGVPTTVIGVMPRGFAQPAPTDIWMPFDLAPAVRAAVSGGRTLTTFARIEDGVSREAAVTEVAEITRRTQAAFPADNRDYHYRLQTLRELLLNGAGSTVLLIQVAAGVLLLLAVLNLMALLVAWGFERNQEMAVRLALGGGKWQVVRLLLAQSVIVVGLGLLVGIGLAQGLLLLVRRSDLGPQLGFFLGQLRLDPSVLLASIPVAAAVALLAGVIPAVLIRVRTLAMALRSSSRSVSHSAGALQLQRVMIVLQASLSVVVLASAAVVGLSFRNLAGIPDGFQAGGRVVARVVLPDERYGNHPARVTLERMLLAALASEPSLDGAAFTSTLPVGDIRWGGRFHVPDVNGAITGEPALFHFRRVAPGYLPIMSIPLLAGRHFTAQDDSAAPRVAIISRAVAEQYWPNQDAVGQRIHRAGVAGTTPVPFEIIGVVGDAMDGGYEAPPGQAVYVPFSQVSHTRLSIVARTRTSPADGIAAMRRAIAAVDPLLAATGTATLESIVSSANALPQLRATLLLVFAVASILVAALGSYGVMRQLVSNREREFALRLVFGAAPRDLAREVLAQVARLTIPGVAAGLVGAWLAAGLLRQFVFGIDPRSLPLLAAVSAGVLGIAVATALPTMRRAMRIDVRRGAA